jgi:hypothetical protein
MPAYNPNFHFNNSSKYQHYKTGAVIQQASYILYTNGPYKKNQTDPSFLSMSCRPDIISSHSTLLPHIYILPAHYVYMYFSKKERILPYTLLNNQDKYNNNNNIYKNS